MGAPDDCKPRLRYASLPQNGAGGIADLVFRVSPMIRSSGSARLGAFCRRPRAWPCAQHRLAQASLGRSNAAVGPRGPRRVSSSGAAAVGGGVVVVAYLLAVPDSTRVLLPWWLVLVYPVAVHALAEVQDTPLR